jgi:predicted CopG family antitoxin
MQTCLIKIKPETRDTLKELKICNRDTYDEVILRLIKNQVKND